MSASVYVRIDQQAPLRHRRALCPTVANELGRELDWRVYDGLDSEMWGSLRSITPPHLRVGRASMSRAQRGQSECLVRGKWGVDEIKGSNPMWKYDRRKKGVQIRHGPYET